MTSSFAYSFFGVCFFFIYTVAISATSLQVPPLRRHKMAVVKRCIEVNL